MGAVSNHPTLVDLPLGKSSPMCGEPPASLCLNYIQVVVAETTQPISLLIDNSPRAVPPSRTATTPGRCRGIAFSDENTPR